VNRGSPRTLLLGNLIESIAETSREDPFEGVFPSGLVVIESIAIIVSIKCTGSTRILVRGPVLS
jgi:hypothetical protein